MSQAILEHVNYTTKNPQKTAAWMQKVFGWMIRWEGPALNDGYTIHIGGDAFYIALYAPAEAPLASSDPHSVQNGLNHLGVIVEDLAATEVAAKALGFVTYGHADYAPGQRFYFKDDSDVEFEIVSYRTD